MTNPQKQIELHFSQHKEFYVLKKLNTPQKIQDFINKIPINFEKSGDTLRSPLSALRRNEIHCFEGALLAATILWQNGEKPLILDLKTTNYDQSHVVALFKRKNLWGAISKTNHAVLRYRDPIYKNIRELSMSYFNEYFLNNGEKTLRSYSDPFDLSKLGADWLTSKKNLWEIDDMLDKHPHHKILEKSEERYLRLADKIEIESGKLIEWKRKKT